MCGEVLASAGTQTSKGHESDHQLPRPSTCFERQEASYSCSLEIFSIFASDYAAR